ncbi:transcriptional regulator [Mammaliicoccus sp. D-M17]|uniref:transcriptional regulator n=1 Tax=Mammaliicoccus sp. D-M17 TaxID=2898677 RepID=UPI001EFBD9CB|nr:transcriptional regulator [Mammaliicoccus sp. D-M17]
MRIIERYDIRKLEDYIINIDQYRKELKMREYELFENHEPDNPGGGKSNLPTSTIEIQTVRKLSDNRYVLLSNIVSGVDKLISNAKEDTKDMIRLRYWECPIGCYEWEDIANYFGTSKTSILRRRNSMLLELADYIGYV